MLDIGQAIQFLQAAHNVSWAEKLALLATLWVMLKKIESNLKVSLKTQVDESVKNHVTEFHNQNHGGFDAKSLRPKGPA